jgi:hypothetical protein
MVHHSRILIVAAIVLGLIVIVPFAPKIFSGLTDEVAIATATSSVDKFQAFLKVSHEMPLKELFPKFIQQADAAEQGIDLSYTLLNQNAENGHKPQLLAIRDGLGDVQNDLSAWRNAAAESDAAAFYDASVQYNTSVKNLNKAIHQRKPAFPFNTTEQHSTTGTSIAFALLALGLPILLIIRNKKLKERPAATHAENTTLTVSPRTFLLLNFLTLGGYMIYWGWQSWEVIAKVKGEKYHSTIRSIFIVFTAFSLFKQVRILASEAGYRVKLRDQLIAATMLLISVATTPLFFLCKPTLLLMLVSVVAHIVIVTLLVSPVLKAQAYYAKHTSKTLLPLGKDLWPIGLATTSVVISIASIVDLALT